MNKLSANPINWHKLGIESDFNPSLISKARILWGVAPTGDVHLGYAASLLLLRKLQKMGAEVILLLANYHGYFDCGKTQWESIADRTRHYRKAFARVGFPNVIETKNFYIHADYIELLFRTSALCSIKDALAAGCGTLRAPPKKAAISDLLYVLTQVVDVQYLGVNVVLCGQDESPIYRYGLAMLAKKFNLNCSHIYLPMCPGLKTTEMHASDDVQNKILMSDGFYEILTKLRNHYKRWERWSEAPPLASFCSRVLFPLAERDDLVDELRTRQQGDSSPPMKILAKGIWEVLKDLHGERHGKKGFESR